MSKRQTAKKQHIRKRSAVVKKHSSRNKKSRTRRNRRKQRGGVKYVSAPGAGQPDFFPKGFHKVVPYLPTGGPATTGDAFPHKYYAKAADLGAPNGYIRSSSEINASLLQKGGALSDLVPDFIKHLGRETVHGGEKAVATVNANTLPISRNPDPTKQGLEAEKMDSSVVDVPSIAKHSEKVAASIKPKGI